MTTGIFLNGHVQTFNDPVRSEVRWALNLGKVLKWAGWNDLVFINNGNFRIKSLSDNIPVIDYDDPERRNLKVLFNLPWSFKNEPCDSIAGKNAQTCVHFNFTLNVKEASCSHLVAYPFKTTKFNLSGQYRLIFLPYPSPVPNFNEPCKVSTKWVWSSRWAFASGPWEDSLQATLKGVRLAALSTKAQVIIIETENARFNKASLEGVKCMSVKDPNYMLNCDLLSRSILSLRTPILFGNQLESVALGSCPLVFNDIPDQEAGILTPQSRELGLALNSETVEHEQISDQLVKLHIDQELKYNVLRSYQGFLRDHEWKAVLEKIDLCLKS